MTATAPSSARLWPVQRRGRHNAPDRPRNRYSPKEHTMTTTVITLPVAAIIDRLDHGKRWTKGWGDWQKPERRNLPSGAARSYATAVRAQRAVTEALTDLAP